MLDLKRIREAPDEVRANLARRGNPEYAAKIDAVLELDEERRALIKEVDALRSRRNEVTPQVAVLKREGRHEEAERLIVEMRELGDRVGQLEARLGEVEASVEGLLLELPNEPAPDVPAGGEDANVVVRQWGEPAEFSFEPKPHWELGAALGIMDFPRGAKVAGSGFPLMIGAGARLERALINFMMDLHANEHGYTEAWPPFLVNRQAAQGTGHLPKFGEDMYYVGEDGFYLVPTAEVPVTNFH